MYKSAGRGCKIEVVVLDCSAINDLDTTALEALGKIIDSLNERNIELHMAGVKGPVREVLKKAGLYDDLGEHKRIFRTTYRAILDILADWSEDKEDDHIGEHYKNTNEYCDKEDMDPPKYQPDDIK